MNSLPPRIGHIACVLGLLVVGQVFGWRLALAASTNLPPLPPDTAPSLPPVVSPIDRFRALLELGPAEREAELASRTPSQREYLRARVQEFDQLSSRERELRLELLALRHYLLPVLGAHPTNRLAGLQAVPLAYRDLVRGRLAVWERLSPDQQRAMLESESIFAGLAYVTTPEGLVAGERAMEQLSADKRQRLDGDLVRWQALPSAERARITAQFKEFLMLTEVEKQKALAGLEDPRRQEAARLVERLQRLTPEQRFKSIEAFARFSALAPAERDRFRRNAARWSAMSSEERLAWRRLLAKGPPTPAGLPRGAAADVAPPPAPASPPPFPRSSTPAVVPE